MSDPTKDPAVIGGLAEALRAWRETLPEQFFALLLSGVAGAWVRAVFLPEMRLVRRLVEALAGVCSAMTLGWLLGAILDGWTDAGTPAYCGAAFAMGEGG
ncbi:hypothetical protein KM176_24440, partial [Pseudooceanicola sp. CBS1P-1]